MPLRLCCNGYKNYDEVMMRKIATTATISPMGDVILDRVKNLPVGKFKVVLVIDESPITTENIAEESQSERSFLDVAGNLIGCLEGLPTDLSVNKYSFIMQ